MICTVEVSYMCVLKGNVTVMTVFCQLNNYNDLTFHAKLYSVLFNQHCSAFFGSSLLVWPSLLPANDPPVSLNSSFLFQEESHAELQSLN